MYRVNYVGCQNLRVIIILSMIQYKSFNNLLIETAACRFKKKFGLPDIPIKKKMCAKISVSLYYKYKGQLSLESVFSKVIEGEYSSPSQ